MKNLFRRFICISLILALLITPIFAEMNTNDDNTIDEKILSKEKSELKKVSKEVEKQILRDDKLTKKMVKIKSLDDLTLQQVQDILEMNELMESQGFTSQGILFYEVIENSETMLNNEKQSILPYSYSRTAALTDFRTEYLNVPFVKTKKDKGIFSVSLGAVFNIVIGSKTRHFWKAATILGVIPSLFTTKYHYGDYVHNSIHVNQRHKYYKATPEWSTNIQILARTTKITVIDAVTASGLYANGNYYFDQKSTESNPKTYYSDNYYDTSYIMDIVSSNATGNIQTPYFCDLY